MSVPVPAARGNAPRVKICGLTRRSDALDAVRFGADYLGVVLAPGSPRRVSALAAGEITAGLGTPLVIVTVDHGVSALVHAAWEAGASILQLHGDETPADVLHLREAGDWAIWKAVRVREAGDVTRAMEEFSGAVEGFVLDAWHPERHGGTGVRFAWDEVATLLAGFSTGADRIVAGGLVPENVAEAVRVLQPDTVDVSSEVESVVGQKDPARVESFIRAAKSAGR